MNKEFVNDISDPVTYQQVWAPKVQSYKADLAKSVMKQYLAPKKMVPKSMDIPVDVTKIPPKVLSKEVIRITESSATELVKQIAEGKLSATETLAAFLERATISHQLTNCAMQFLVEEALERAAELDKFYASTGKTVGPLHGLPISIKEHIGMKGKVTHAAFVSFIDNIPERDAVTIQVLRKAGAVFYIRTNEPQSLMHQDSNNNITGRTGNPYNTSLSPGGSSSGEGALIGMSGSPLGVGTDIGGSIRAPAAYCGIWGLRPTTRRISTAGCVSAGFGQETIVSAMGPLARSGEDIDLFMSAYLDQAPWDLDSSLVPLEWRSTEKPQAKNLTIAIVFDDGIVRPHPPIERGLKLAEKALKDAGVNVVTWKPYKTSEAWELAMTAYTADGNLKQRSALSISGEPVVPLTEWALIIGKGDKGISVAENHCLNRDRDVLRADYHRIMNEKGIDFILGPTYVGVAPLPDTIKYGNYCSMWNVLDMPGVVFPVGLHQDPKIDLKLENHILRNEYEEYEYPLYEPHLFENAPICFQLNGRRYQDEKLVKAAQVVAEIIKSSV